MPNFEKYKAIVRELLDDKAGCEWIKQKSIQDIGAYTLEETYELLAALESGNFSEIRDELADLCFHLLLYAEMAERQGEFNLSDVIDVAIRKQAERREPTELLSSADEAHQRWQERKYAKQLAEGTTQGLLDDIPKNMPALLRSKKIQDKTEQVGFDWTDPRQVIDKLKEEIAEFELELDREDQTALMDELGDILFTAVNIGRHINVDPELALRHANDKFITRFRRVEQQSKTLEKPLHEMSFDALLDLWEKAKKG